MDSGLQVLDSGFSVNVNETGFQSLVGFGIPSAEFRIPPAKISRTLDSTGTNFPDYGIRIPLRVSINNSNSRLSLSGTPCLVRDPLILYT